MIFRETSGLGFVAEGGLGCGWLAPDLKDLGQLMCSYLSKLIRRRLTPLELSGAACTQIQVKHMLTFIIKDSACTRKANFHSILTKPWEVMMLPH